jgi:hypothetical protein
MVAEVAIPPSPEVEAVPFPATVATRYDRGAADAKLEQQAARVKRKRTVERKEAKPTRKNKINDELTDDGII